MFIHFCIIFLILLCSHNPTLRNWYLTFSLVDNQAYIICPLVQTSRWLLEKIRETCSQWGIFLCSLHKANAWPVMPSYTHWSEERKIKFLSIFIFSVMWLTTPHLSKIKMALPIAVTNNLPWDDSQRIPLKVKNWEIHLPCSDFIPKV